MTTAVTVDAVAARPHIALLAAGDWVYIYSGHDRAEVLAAARFGEFGMVAANLDTLVRWVTPARFRALYAALVLEVGHANVSLMPDHDDPTPPEATP